MSTCFFYFLCYNIYIKDKERIFLMAKNIIQEVDE